MRLPVVALLLAWLPIVACSDPANTQQTGLQTFTGGDVSAAFGNDADAKAAEDVSSPVVDTSSHDVMSAKDVAQAPDAGSKVDVVADIATGPCPGGAGCVCAKSSDCKPGPCIFTPDGMRCSDTCTDDEGCPDGWTCRTDLGGPAGGRCVPPWPHLCEPCASSSSCGQVEDVPKAGATWLYIGHACVDRGDLGAFCGTPCNADADCPEAFGCQSVKTVEGTSIKQCMPDDVGGKPGECNCSKHAAKQALSTSCKSTLAPPGGGPPKSCVGTRTCTDIGLTACDAKTPAVEVCDGVDNDCDGKTDDLPCEDDNICTTDFCGAKGCQNAPTTGGPCDDGDACTIGELCGNGVCSGGQSACACKSDADCLTGDLCPGTLYCDKAKLPWACKLQPGSAVVCDASNDSACAKNVCNGPTGKCFMAAVSTGTPCDDGDSCTANDACQGGVCKPGVSACECKVSADCAAKDDGNPCNGKLICNAATNKCVIDPASVVTCLAVKLSCQKNACVPATGKCAPQPVADGVACDDGAPCTAGDLCSKGQCKPGKSLCECKTNADCAGKGGGNLCLGKWSCVANSCKLDAGTAVVCGKDKDTGCLKNACVPATGGCQLSPLPNGALCMAVGPCAGQGKCSSGSCVAADGKACDDGNACTKDTCDGNSGKCLYAVLADGTPCGGGATCKKGTCIGATKVSVKAPDVADAWLEKDNANYGSQGLLILAVSGNYPMKRSLIRFDLSKLPKGAKVALARMRIYVTYWHNAGGGGEKAIDRQIDLHRVLRAWDEKKVTSKTSGVAGLNKYWQAKYLALNDFDAAKTPAATALWKAASSGWKEFDITALAQAWVDQPAKNFGILLRAQNESKKGREPRMHSREAGGAGASLRPHLVIDYFK